MIAEAKRQRLFVTVILLVSFAASFNTLFNGFVFDDEFQVVKNPWIRDWGSLGTIFTTGVWNFQSVASNYYRPMMHVMYLLAYHVFGLTPWGFHLLNLLFHAGVSVMVFLVARRLLGPDAVRNSSSPRPAWTMMLYPPFVAGVLFAVYPVHTEAVAWVAGLPDLSCAFFFFLSFYLFTGDDKGMTNRAFSVAAFAVALLCKEVAMVLPALLIAYDFVCRKSTRFRWEEVKDYLPYFIVAGAYLAVRAYALGGLIPVSETYRTTTGRELGQYEFFINIFPLFAQYLRVLVLPINLSAWHEFRPATSLLSGDVLSGIAVTAAFLAALYFSAKKNANIFLALLLILLPLLPALYFKGIGSKPFAERYLYLPSVGFMILLALFIASTVADKPGRAGIMAVAVTILAGLYSAGTITRNAVWKDDLTFWTETVSQSPDAAEPHYNLANVLRSLGRTKEALFQYQAAIRNSRSPKVLAAAYDNVGNIYQDAGMPEKAVEQYQLAIMQKRDSPNFYNNLGTAYIELGRTDEAIENFQAALRLDPSYANAYYNLGMAYTNKGLKDEALRCIGEAVRLEPSDPGYRDAFQQALELKTGKGTSGQ